MIQIPSLFGSGKTNIIGLDISTTAVKLLELGRDGSRYRVESYSVEPLPPNSIIDKQIADTELVGEAIRKAVKRSGTKATLAAAALAGSDVITKVIPMPDDLSDEEMQGQIEVEADQYIPYPIEEVSLDFEVIGETEGAPGKVDVLLVASRREHVDNRSEAIEMGGLTPRVIDVETYAMENAFTLIREQLPDHGLDKTIAIIDVGATMTTLSVIHDLKTVYTREQVFGGKQLTEEIQRRYGLSYEEAGMAKRQGGLPDDYLSEVLEPFKQAMVQQVGRSLQYFFAASNFNEVDHIVLAGGSSSIAGMEEYIQKREGIPALVANPFSKMVISPKIKAQILGNDAPALMTACGLALRSFD
ncbi:MAG: pilus assembly protein PilM [Gammaproteobacteria bacterium]|nr:pilus assembly protein PilM [Gammaproteobacteria bacterium]